MSNTDIERATTTTADMVAAGLEQHARAITARVISLLSEDRAHFTRDIDDFKGMLGAIALEAQAGRRESNEGQAALIAGLRGLAQDLSVVTESVEGAIRGLGKIERDVRALNKRHGGQIAAIAERMDASEADRADLREQLNQIKQLITEARADGNQ